MAAPKTKVDMVKTPDKPTLVPVELIGTPNELLGEHNLFHGGQVISFIDGKAIIPSTTADELRKLGQVK